MMTNCKEFTALLDLYADGELSPEEMLRVQAHLDTCSACRAYVDDALAIRASFPEAEETEVPDGFTESVMAAVRQSGAPVKPTRRTPWKKTLLPLAACFAVAVLVLPRRGMLSGGAKKESAAALAMADTAETESAFEAPAEAPAPAAAAPRPAQAASEEDLYSRKATNESETPYGQVPAEGAAPAAGSTQLCCAETQSDTGAVPSCLVLTAEEAGEALADLTPVEETETELHYELTAEELDALLAALAQAGVTPAAPPQSAEAEGATTLVIVTK